MSTKLKPLVGVISDLQVIEPHDYHTVGDKYLRALSQVADVVPTVVPALFDDHDVEQWLSRLDGLLLTGAYSMLDPKHYGESRLDKAYRYDQLRDETSFAMIRYVIEHDLPLMGICRGIQDVNVALGGTLYQAIQEVNGMMDHREDTTQPVDVQYGDAHKVTLTQGGKLQQLLDCDSIIVNSVHSQGINRLASGLTVEAVAADGLVEAVSVDAMSFGLAVQWHPEWRAGENPSKQKLFNAFGDACRAQLTRR